jgi:short chain dehydrogenase
MRGTATMANVLITGCSSGFGLLTARTFARRGDHVFATVRDRASAGELKALRDSELLPIFILQLDVRDTTSVHSAVSAALASGPIDLLVNNAGYSFRAAVEETERRRTPPAVRYQLVRHRAASARRAANDARSALRNHRQCLVSGLVGTTAVQRRLYEQQGRGECPYRALRNTLRRTVHQGQPLVLGVHLIGDATCTTNPTGGRGVSYAIATAGAAAQVIADQPDDLMTQALQLDEFITHEIEPRFQENVRADIGRVQRMRADLTGHPPADVFGAEQRVRLDELLVAAMQDADLYRAFMRYAMVLKDPPDLSDPCLIEQLRRHVPAGIRPLSPAGPTRAELVQILAES